MEERTSGFKPVKKKKGRFNLVDFLMLFLVAAILFVVLFVVDPFSINLFGAEAREITLEYTLRIDNVENALVNKIQMGDEVIDASVKTSLGYVSAVENDMPHTEPYYDPEEDIVVMKEYPNRYDVVVTVSSKATVTEGQGYTVNGRRVAVGTQFYLMFPDYTGSGNCISVREIG